MNTKETALIAIRVPLEVKKQFEMIAVSNDITVSQLLRAYIREYVKCNSQRSIGFKNDY
jgi:hypothetical protein